MTKIVYEVVEHDGGWAYRMNGAFSESFPSHSDAMQAALIAAKAQQKRVETDEASLEAEDTTETTEPVDFEIVDRRRGSRRFNLSNHA